MVLLIHTLAAVLLTAVPCLPAATRSHANPKTGPVFSSFWGDTI